MKLYLAFENALESIKYYEDNFGATLLNHSPVTNEMLEHFNIDSCEGTTFSATLLLFGNEFQLSDRFDHTEEFTKSMNIMIEFSQEENKQFEESISSLSNIEILFSNIEDAESPYRMHRFLDKYGVIWCLVLA